MRNIYIATACERLMRVSDDGALQDVETKPWADPDVIYEGGSLDEACAAANGFAAANPYGFEAVGEKASVVYWEIECNLVDEDGECEDVFAFSTLNDTAIVRLRAHAGRAAAAPGELDDLRH